MKKNTLLTVADREDIRKRCHARFVENVNLQKEFGTKEVYSSYILGAWEGLFPKSAPEKPKKKPRRLTYQEEKDLCELAYLLWDKHEKIRSEFRSKEIFAAYKKAECSGLISA